MSPASALAASTVLVTSSATRLTVTGMVPIAVPPAALERLMEPYQVWPASIASSSQKARTVKGSPSGLVAGPSAVRLPSSPATTAVSRSTVSVPASLASQFCTRIHQGPSSPSPRPMSMLSADPPEALEATWVAALGSVPLPTNRSKSGAVAFCRFTIRREAPSGTVMVLVTVPLPSKGSALVVSSATERPSLCAGTRPLACTSRAVISTASIGSDSAEPASRRVSISIDSGSAPLEGLAATGRCAAGASEPSAGVSVTLPNWKSSTEDPLTSAVTVISWVSPAASSKEAGSTVTSMPSVTADPSAVQVPAPVSVASTVRVHVQDCRQSNSAMLAVLRVVTSPPTAGSAARYCSSVASSSSPASAALVRSTRPEPMSYQSAAVPSLSVTSVTAVVIRADWACAGVQSGCSAATSASAPATWGLAIEVPEMKPHLTSLSMPSAARMSTPGAEMLGLISSTALFGPRLENPAMMSATSSPMYSWPPESEAVTPSFAARKERSSTPSS